MTHYTFSIKKPDRFLLRSIWGAFLSIVFLMTLLVLDGYAFQNYDILSQNHLWNRTVPAQFIKVHQSEGEEYIVSMNVKNMKLTTALRELTEQINVGLSYDSEADLDHTISYKAQDAAFYDALDRMLNGTGLEYLVSPNRNVLVIRPLKDSNDESLQHTVNGLVTDAQTGEPLPGVNIMIEGTSSGTSTDSEGIFELSVENLQDTLIVSYIGYEQLEVPIDGQNELMIELVPSVISGDELVVVGYGAQKRGDLTGAIETVDANELENRSVSSVLQSLQGQIPGLRIIQESGQPGNLGMNVNIRGISTFTDNPVLTIIDGVPSEINTINPNDIESISVLKDAAAASIYGTRASGGVILITTKSGISGVPRLSYDGSVGVQQPTRIPQKVSAYEHAINYNEAESNDSPGRSQFTFSDEDLARFSSEDWKEPDMPGYLLNPALTTDHNIGLSGGSDLQRYYMSIGYLKQDGIVRNTGYERLNIRYNQEINLSDWLNLKFIGSHTPSTQTEPASYAAPGSRNSDLNSAIREAFRYGNFTRLFTPSGEWASIRGSFNALAMGSEEGGDGILKSNLTTGNFSVNANLIDNLELSAVYGINHTITKREDFRKKIKMYSPATPNVVDFEIDRNALRVINGENTLQSIQFLADYNHNVKDHNISFLGGYNQEWFRSESQAVGRSDFITENTRVIGAGSTNRDVWLTEGEAYDWALRSFIGRASYTFQNKYILESSFRIDGSSRFVSDLRWTIFPSISAAWRISEEGFLDESDVINHLKIRASWGQVGNQNVGFYPFASTISTSIYPFGGATQQTAFLDGAANSNLTWETKTSKNVGLDMQFLNDFNLNFDFYHERTTDILLAVPVPTSFGLSAPPQNVGTVDNMGWELQLSHNKQFDDFGYNISLNISDATNEVIDLRGAGPFIRDQASVTNSPGGQITEEGHPMNMWYGYEANGLFQSDEEVDSHAFQSNLTSPGDIKYVDQNGDGVINSDDRTRLGRSDIRRPFGITINMQYKNLEFTAFGQGVLQHKQHVFGWMANNFDRPSSTIFEYHLDRWTPENRDARFPKHRVAQQIGINAQFSSFQLQDAAYFRMKNMEIAYNLPVSFTSKLNIRDARVFMSGENVFTITNFLGWDPEIASIRNVTYPNARIFNIGVNLNF